MPKRRHRTPPRNSKGRFVKRASARRAQPRRRRRARKSLFLL